MFKKPLIAVLLIFISGISALSQTGKFYLSQFYPESNEIDNQNFDLIQDRYGVVYIANRAGVVTFDGHQWNLIKTPYSIFSMAIDSTNNMLYVAGKEGVGRIALNEQQELKFDAFLGDDNEQLRDIFTLLLHDGELYFNNSESIFIYNFKSKTLDRLSAGYTGELLQLFLFKDEVYVNTSVSGVKLIAKDKLQNPSELILADQNVTLLVQNNSKEEYLVGFSDNQLSTYKNGVLKPIDLKRNQNYLDDAEVIEGLWVNDSLVAVSTLKGGVVFVNIKTAKIEEIVNYQSGLPDNEVYALSMDSNNGVWVAHSEGFTRISPTFPFRNFNRYPGLEGKILTVVRHEGKLYVGTTLGLYHLDEVRQYSEKVSYSKKRIKVSVQQDEIEQRPKRGVFNFLRRKKSIDKPTSEYKEKVIYESVIEKNLEGVIYEYKKILPIDSKVFQLESFDDLLFSGGLNGLYLINDTTSNLITKDPVRYYYMARQQRKVIVNTYADEIKVYDLSSGYPNEIYAFGDFKDFVQYIFEDRQKRLWFCSPDEIYWVSFKGNELETTETFSIDNPYYFNTYGTFTNDSVIFANEKWRAFYNERENKIQQLPSVKKSPERYLRGASGKVYTYQNNQWNFIGAAKRPPELDLIGLFKNLSYISSDQADNYWVVNTQNELYALSAHQENNIVAPYNLYLKKAENNAKPFMPTPNLKFDQDESSLYFEVAQPEYSGILEIEYQYKLKGLPSKKWSDWSSKNNVISFPYLPDGRYELKVRSRTALGTVTDMEPIRFKVVPPYWRRPWFYFLEVLVIALVLYGSIRIKRMGYRYRLVSRLLALLVLIIVVEFIQTIAENRFGTQSSPFWDFVIQVTMAIIILPVESVLRKYIFKDKEVKVMDFITLKNKNKQE